MCRRFLDSEDSYDKNDDPSGEARNHHLHNDDVNAEEEKKGGDLSGAAQAQDDSSAKNGEIDADSVLVKSFSYGDQSSYHHLRVNAQNQLGLHKQASMSVFAVRSSSQYTTLPNAFRADHP